MNQSPANLKCPFRATLITRSFSCEHASEVTRRDGPDIGCSSELSNKQCSDCFAGLKSWALPELGFTDDLTSMPASAVQKIQFGGLLGLQAQVSGSPTGESVENISKLMQAAYEKYSSLDSFPFDQCVESIKDFQIKRRRGK